MTSPTPRTRDGGAKAEAEPKTLRALNALISASSPLVKGATHRWWLDQELKLVHPRLVVALGATAVLALARKPLPIVKFRGPVDFHGRPGFITVHPSYLLRMPDRDAKEQGYREFVRDLREIRKRAASRDFAR